MGETGALGPDPGTPLAPRGLISTAAFLLSSGSRRPARSREGLSRWEPVLTRTSVLTSTPRSCTPPVTPPRRPGYPAPHSASLLPGLLGPPSPPPPPLASQPEQQGARARAVPLPEQQTRGLHQPSGGWGGLPAELSAARAPLFHPPGSCLRSQVAPALVVLRGMGGRRSWLPPRLHAGAGPVAHACAQGWAQRGGGEAPGEVRPTPHPTIPLPAPARWASAPSLPSTRVLLAGLALPPQPPPHPRPVIPCRHPLPSRHGEAWTWHWRLLRRDPS